MNIPERPAAGLPRPVGATLRSPNSAPKPHATPRRKPNRLARDLYQGRGAYSVTANTNNRHRAFTDPTAVRECLFALNEAATKFDVTTLAYCFMPDHLHLLVLGGEHSNLIDFMKRFKQLSGFGHKQRTRQVLWQKGYFDRIVWAEEALEEIAEYIFANPVRAGLVNEPAGYPYSGGQYFQPMLGGRPEGRPYTKSIPA